MKYNFSWKFYVGLIILILSFVVAKGAQVIFIMYYDNFLLRQISLVLYILTWPMLFWGAWWSGKEYTEKVKKYFSYKYYHDTAKNKLKRKKTISQ